MPQSEHVYCVAVAFKMTEWPWLVWLTGLTAGLQIKGSLV